MSIEELKLFEDKISHFNNNSVIDMRDTLRKDWENIKKDEDALAYAISVSAWDKDKKAQNITLPNIGGLILLDYESIDPLIYDALIYLIYSSPILARFINPISRPYSFLTSSLFNPSLELNKEQMDFLFNELTKNYDDIIFHYSKIMRLETKIDINKYNKEYCNVLFKDLQRHITNLETLINERNSLSYYADKPGDIRYFILTHPIISKLADKDLLDKLFMNKREFRLLGSYNNIEDYITNFYKYENADYESYKSLLGNATERVKIRKLGRIPF